MFNRDNSIRTRQAAGQVAIGGFAALACGEAVEIIGISGYDFVVIDAEHGSIGFSSLVQMIRAADAVGISAIVRIPDKSPSYILRLLDAGAAGILAAHLRTREDAEALVKAVKFAPEGERGACPSTRVAGYRQKDWTGFARRSNAQTIVWGLIEDVEGVENIEEIGAVKGLDGVIFGNFDLSQAMGHEGELHHPAVLAMFERVKRGLRGSHVELIALTAFEPGGMQGARERSARIVIQGSDRGILTNVLRSTFEQLSSVFRPGETADRTPIPY